MINVMVDLETLGTGPNSVIISIGAVEFNAKTQTLGHEFYINIDPQSCVNFGLEIDASTVMWWMKQSDAARNCFEKKGAQLQEALAMFSAWYPQAAPLWGNGASFDNVILSNAYMVAKVPRPWSYSKDRCYRTLKALMPEIKADETGGTYHNALDDAKYQALHALKLMNSISAI